MPHNLRVAHKLEEQYVHDVYTHIAPHFNDSRYKPWPKVKKFLNCLAPGSLVADVGCGDGKYGNVNSNIHIIGCDLCPQLLNIAQQRSNQVIMADNLALPYRDNTFDAVLSVAVIHHLCTWERRLKAIEELARVSKPGAQLLLCVWALEQSHRKFTAQDVLVPWHLHLQSSFKKTSPSKETGSGSDSFNREVIGLDKLTTADRVIGGSVGIEPIAESTLSRSLTKLYSLSSLFKSKKSIRPSAVIHAAPPPAIPWRSYISKLSPRIGRALGVTEENSFEKYIVSLATKLVEEAVKDAESATSYGPTYYRYYHVFREGELDELVSAVPDLRIVHSFYDHANWCLIAMKTNA